MMRRISGLRLSQAYPGTLGVTTEKGQQNTYPLTMDYPAYSYEIMLLRWQTGVYEVGAPPPLEDAQMIQGIPVIVVLTGGVPVTQVNYDGAPDPGPGGPVGTVTDNGYGIKITLVDSGGVPMNLFNLDGTRYEGGGVPTYLTINGVSSILLIDSDGTPLQDNDGTYLYEAA